VSANMTYKGHPVVRDNNKLYFGDPSNPFMIVLTVLENKPLGENVLPSRVLVQLQKTDPALAMSGDKIVKEGERKNLFDALELGSIWLEKQLS